MFLLDIYWCNNSIFTESDSRIEKIFFVWLQIKIESFSSFDCKLN